jgi:hypothetical protein
MHGTENLKFKTKSFFSGSAFPSTASFELFETANGQTVSSSADLRTGGKRIEISERSNA